MSSQRESLSTELTHDFDVALANYSNTFNQPPELVLQHTDFVTVTGPDSYMPFPELAFEGSSPRDVTIICNTDALQETWEPIFAGTNGVTTSDARRIYFGMGFAWIGLVHSALDAKQERHKLDDMRADVRSGDLDNAVYLREAREFAKKMKTVLRIQEALHDAEAIKHTLEELECAGKIEASLYPYEVDDDEVQRVNRIRYGLGASYVMNDLPQNTRDQLSLQFAQSLSDYTSSLGTSLVDFAHRFGLNKRIDPEEYKQIGLSRAFHSLYFAGIVPIDLSDMIRPTTKKQP